MACIGVAKAGEPSRELLVLHEVWDGWSPSFTSPHRSKRCASHVARRIRIASVDPAIAASRDGAFGDRNEPRAPCNPSVVLLAEVARPTDTSAGSLGPRHVGASKIAARARLKSKIVVMPNPDGSTWLHRWPDLLEGLTVEQRRAVITAVATNVLEGWRPSRADIQALVDVVCDRTTIEEYINAVRTGLTAR